MKNIILTTLCCFMSSIITAQIEIPTIAELKSQGLVHEVSSFEYNASGIFGDENTHSYELGSGLYILYRYVCEYNLKAGDIITTEVNTVGGMIGGGVNIYNEQEELQPTDASQIIAFKAETDGIYYVVIANVLNTIESEEISYSINLLRYGTISSISFLGELPSSDETSEYMVKAILSDLSAKGTDTYGEEINLFSGNLNQWTIDIENKIAYFNPVAIPFSLNFPLTLAEGIDNSVSWAQNSINNPLIDNLKIFTNNRTITIENAVTEIEILDVTGRIVAQSAGNTYEVAQAGVYIVRANGTAKKVIIQ